MEEPPEAAATPCPSPGHPAEDPSQPADADVGHRRGGSRLNWLTLEQIADAADLAYRRRFLLEKYPQLAESETVVPLHDDVATDGDDPSIAVLSLLRDAGADVDEETNDGDSK